jgi:hypothetical protein
VTQRRGSRLGEGGRTEAGLWACLMATSG